MENDEWVGVAFVFSLFVVIIFILLIATNVEQNTFNKFSKTTATYIEALFTKLRVIPD
jgi:hypothetical protein